MAPRAAVVVVVVLTLVVVLAVARVPADPGAPAPRRSSHGAANDGAPEGPSTSSRAAAGPEARVSDVPSRSGCPPLDAFFEAAAAVQVLALTPRAQDEAARRAQAAASAQLREALPDLGPDIDTWDRVERRWADQLRDRDRGRPASGAHELLDDPAFVEAVDRIEAAAIRACRHGR